MTRMQYPRRLKATLSEIMLSM